MNNGWDEGKAIDLFEGNRLMGVAAHNSDETIGSAEVDTYNYFFFLNTAGGYVDGYFAHKLFLDCKGS